MMALYDTHRSTATPLSTVLATRIADLLLAAGDRLATGLKPRAKRIHLSDAQLHDLGLERDHLNGL